MKEHTHTHIQRERGRERDREREGGEGGRDREVCFVGVPVCLYIGYCNCAVASCHNLFLISSPVASERPLVGNFIYGFHTLCSIMTASMFLIKYG